MPRAIRQDNPRAAIRNAAWRDEQIEENAFMGSILAGARLGVVRDRERYEELNRDERLRLHEAEWNLRRGEKALRRERALLASGEPITAPAPLTDADAVALAGEVQAARHAKPTKPSKKMRDRLEKWGAKINAELAASPWREPVLPVQPDTVKAFPVGGDTPEPEKGHEGEVSGLAPVSPFRRQARRPRAWSVSSYYGDDEDDD
ncbi:hypothetical protein QMG83_03390 [Salinibacterium sp. G-O1]|uniref:hypothetical protein n=1 Tax=Salinibacterium sp. G-O1 TaxID=3046208 RepID=UPI0024BAE146|nr:hypothetical protein [Salinibacterium sp. G-O1]MDJ0334263.1 hypothetical protein [Salinibacterium sp. G-O1]